MESSRTGPVATHGGREMMEHSVFPHVLELRLTWQGSVLLEGPKCARQKLLCTLLQDPPKGETAPVKFSVGRTCDSTLLSSEMAAHASTYSGVWVRSM